MAIAGAPRIVTQTASALRVSNETEGGFVQQANTGLVTSAIDGEPIFVLADRIIARRIEASPKKTVLNLYDLDLNLLSSYEIPVEEHYTFAYSALDSLFIGVPQGVRTVARALVPVILSANRNTLSAGPAQAGFNQATASQIFTQAKFSPDGNFLVFSQSNPANTVSVYGYRKVGSNNWVVASVTLLGPTSVVESSPDSNFIFAGGGNRTLVLKRAGTPLTLSLLTELVVPGAGRTVHRIAPSPDNVFLAVSSVEDDGGLTVYNTFIYKRGGEKFLPVGSIPDFGGTLSWNEKGNQLYDAMGRKAYRRDPGLNSFTELVGFMTNIPAGVVQSATSPHVEFPVGRVAFYSGALFDIISGAESMEGWKIALLDENAVFNTADTSAETILGQYEVHGAHWPEGGKELTNIVFSPYGTQGVFMTADDVDQMIYEGSLSARYAVVYSENDRPLMFVDFQKEIVAENNSKLSLQMGDFGFIMIAP